jgi:hypothetical protein
MTEQAGASNIWVGEVRDIRDPNEGGKVKIIIHGIHNVGPDPIPDDDLPWAHCVMNNSPSLNKMGDSVQYVAGSTVIGLTVDGPDNSQIHYVLGSVHRGQLPLSGD